VLALGFARDRAEPEPFTNGRRRPLPMGMPSFLPLAPTPLASIVFRAAFVLGAAAALAACGGARSRARPVAAGESVAFGEIPQGAFSSAAATACRTSCNVPSASEATAASGSHVAAGLDKAMSSLRGCLSTMGAGEVDPVIFATYAPGGELATAVIDLGGIEASECVAQARTLLPERTADAAGLLRCSQRCSATD